MAAHSRLGASGAHRWLNCSGSVQLEAQFPDPPSSKFATEGTVAHLVGETSLAKCVHPDTLIGLWGNDRGDILYETREEAEELAPPGTEVFEVTDEMVVACEVYYDHVTELMREKIEEGNIFGDHPQLLLEERFNLGWIRNGMFGTNDACVFVPGDYLNVLDYKHGKGHVVEVQDNPQLMYYALGALRRLCWNEELQDWDPKLTPDTVELTVIQPRAKHLNGPVRSWTVTTDYLIGTFLVELQKAAEDTAIPNAPLRAGSWCHFCKAKAICPAIEEAALQKANEVIASMDVSDFLDDDDEPKSGEDKAKAMALKIVNEGPERVAEILEMKPMIEAWLSSVAGYAQGLAEAGQEVPGYKLVRTRSHRKWKDPKKAEQTFELFLEPEDYLSEPKLKSPAQMEKVKIGDKRAKDAVKDLWEAPLGSLTLVEESDTRDAIKVNVLDEDMID